MTCSDPDARRAAQSCGGGIMPASERVYTCPDTSCAGLSPAPVAGLRMAADACVRYYLPWLPRPAAALPPNPYPHPPMTPPSTIFTPPPPRPPPKPVPRPRDESSVERLPLALRERAMRYVFRPGARINEQALGRELGVSRAPLREALNRLVAEGLLDFVMNKGFFRKEI